MVIRRIRSNAADGHGRETETPKSRSVREQLPQVQFLEHAGAHDAANHSLLHMSSVRPSLAADTERIGRAFVATHSNHRDSDSRIRNYLNSMAAADLLTQVEEAISAVLSGQAYTIGERQLTRANLGELRLIRRELLQEMAAGSQMCTLGQLDRPE